MKMMDDLVDLDSLPLRFNPPDGWRDPDPLWISLYQGYVPKPGWSPYRGAPIIPASWPWWEENGTAWHSFFRKLSPPPTRIIGNWFSLAATALLFLIIVPFILEGASAIFMGFIGLVGIIIGVRGVIKNLRGREEVVRDPMEIIRHWAKSRREVYFSQRLRESNKSGANLISAVEQKKTILKAWWGEIPEG